MNQFLAVSNFSGIVVLCVLSAAQWKTNSDLEKRADQLDRTRAQQTAKLADQDITLKNDAEELEDLRQRLATSESSLQAVTAEKNRLASESRELKAALDKWMAAVKTRDAALQHANDLIQKLAVERNDAIAKFNDLADKYNTLVKQDSGAK